MLRIKRKEEGVNNKKLFDSCSSHIIFAANEEDYQTYKVHKEDKHS